jgi:UDP-glucose 4-epimerase
MAVLGDPQSFPITAEHPRDPLNWYGRTKWVNERSLEILADGTFPAHLFLKSNLYGEHYIGDTVVSKATVINFFVDRAQAGEPLTVYKPGTQARNFIHVVDVARAYVRSAERLLRQLDSEETGVEMFEIAGTESMSVMEVAEIVRDTASKLSGTTADVELVENPRSGETMVEEFSVDISKARDVLGWSPIKSVEESIRELLEQNA